MCIHQADQCWAMTLQPQGTAAACVEAQRPGGMAHLRSPRNLLNELWLMNKETCFACLFLMTMNTQGPGHGVLYTLY